MNASASCNNDGQNEDNQTLPMNEETSDDDEDDNVPPAHQRYNAVNQVTSPVSRKMNAVARSTLLQVIFHHLWSLLALHLCILCLLREVEIGWFFYSNLVKFQFNRGANAINILHQSTSLGSEPREVINIPVVNGASTNENVQLTKTSDDSTDTTKVSICRKRGANKWCEFV